MRWSRLNGSNRFFQCTDCKKISADPSDLCDCPDNNKCQDHAWITKRRGGDHSDPESHKRITFCDKCGTEKEA